jgi:3,4-dehydroadipyl-CoA semialdehyde dehydrogenase
MSTSLLPNYLLDRWATAEGKPAPLFDPSTEETIAHCSAHGVDFAKVVAHAHEVGVPALQKLSFSERGKILKALSAAIVEHRDELLDLSTRNGGNTRGDGKFDIDGASGTLAAYASLGKKIETDGWLLDGEGDQLGRSPRAWGQHLFVPRRGVAVLINAFNFPAWGMAEKIACAVLAGSPVICKPGTPSAWVAQRLAEVFVATGALPEGSFQFFCGSAGDLLEKLGPQDSIAFTGSSRTGAMFKQMQAVTHANVRVNIEADSVNAAVLAPDIDGECDAWGIFLRNVATDITQKAGQKCTAVRRILVPEGMVDTVREELAERLGAIKVGNPVDGDVTMGPVASKAQLDDVRQGIERLAALGEVVCGGAGAVHDKGYFVAPTLVLAKDRDAASLHGEEVFGPVATIVPYSGDVESAVEITNRGRGGLVCSAYTNDRKWAKKFVLGVGPWHGRVWLGSDKSAGQMLPPGAVLPMSVHGGPGRAGGGEELGGMRGLEHFMQRVAVQGDQAVLGKAFGSSAD